MNEPGKYDDVCTWVREAVGLGGNEIQGYGGVVVVVLGGDRGTGFSMQADPRTTAILPTILRSLANSIEKEKGA